MTFTAVMIVSLTLGVFGPGSYASAMDRIDQGPILRVLRVTDVPGANNVGLPSGALTVSQFVLSNDLTSAAAHAEKRILLRAGFRSSAISAFGGPGDLQLKSTAVELGSPRLAARALTGETKLSALSQAPANTTVRSAPDQDIHPATLVTFRPAHYGEVGGLEVLACAGSYLYTLRGIDQPDSVSLQTIEKLLTTVMSRS